MIQETDDILPHSNWGGHSLAIFWSNDCFDVQTMLQVCSLHGTLYKTEHSIPFPTREIKWLTNKHTGRVLNQRRATWNRSFQSPASTLSQSLLINTTWSQAYIHRFVHNELNGNRIVLTNLASRSMLTAIKQNQMYWDPELAQIAQRHADQCKVRVDVTWSQS